jgi:hypothetical protein
VVKSVQCAVRTMPLWSTLLRPCRANDSKRSLHQSLGMMAMFRYIPNEVERCASDYAATCTTAFHSDISRQRPLRL